jgi:prolyl oligopeptidase PreP (S9A serine peptidase family)
VLLRVDFAGGHGITSTREQAIDEWTDVFAFLQSQLGGLVRR